MADERVIAPDPLNERQDELIKQVKAGKVTEEEPDTETQLLTLARLGHLDLEHAHGEYHFSIPKPAKARKKADSE